MVSGLTVGFRIFCIDVQHRSAQLDVVWIGLDWRVLNSTPSFLVKPFVASYGLWEADMTEMKTRQ